MQMDLKKTLALIYAAMFVIFLLVIINDLYPLTVHVIRLNREIQTLRAASKELPQAEKEKITRQLEQEVKILEKGFQTMQGLVAAHAPKAAKEKNIPLITLMLEDLATSAAIELNLIKPLSSVTEGPYEFVPITLEFQSRYDDLVKFLTTVENSAHMIVVQDLTITRNQFAFPKSDIRLTLNVLFGTQATSASGTPSTGAAAP